MNKHQIFQTAILALLALPVLGSVATIPNEFEAGERARAAEVNENFLSVKEAVDDNHSRINTLESQVKEVGAVSVSAHGFSGFPFTCEYRRSLNYGYFNTPGTTCSAVASVALPHLATITDASCLLYDNDATAFIYPATLIRTTLATDTTNEPVFSTQDLTSTLGSAMVYNMIDTAVSGGTVVDNTTYAYYISVGFDTNSISNPINLRLYSCKVGYSLDNTN
jgi:hypothetical protein